MLLLLLPSTIIGEDEGSTDDLELVVEELEVLAVIHADGVAAEGMVFVAGDAIVLDQSAGDVVELDGGGVELLGIGHVVKPVVGDRDVGSVVSSDTPGSTGDFGIADGDVAGAVDGDAGRWFECGRS